MRSSISSIDIWHPKQPANEVNNSTGFTLWFYLLCLKFYIAANRLAVNLRVPMGLASLFPLQG